MHGRLHPPLDFRAAGLERLAVGVGRDDDRAGATQAAGLNGRGTQNRSQLLARQGLLKAIPAPTIGKPGPAREVGQPLVDVPPRPRGPSGVTHRWPRSIRRSSRGRRVPAPGRRAPDHAEAQPPDHLGDQLAVAVIADQDVHLGPGPVIGREEHDLMEEGVDVALARSAGPPRD